MSHVGAKVTGHKILKVDNFQNAMKEQVHLLKMDEYKALDQTYKLIVEFSYGEQLAYCKHFLDKMARDSNHDIRYNLDRRE